MHWEHNRNLPPKPEENDAELGLDENSFKPQINIKSRQLARDIEKIENRVKLMKDNKVKKLSDLQRL